MPKQSIKEIQENIQENIDTLETMDPPKPDEEPEEPQEEFEDPEKTALKPQEPEEPVKKEKKAKKEEKPEEPPKKEEKPKEGEEEPETPEEKHLRHSNAEAQVLTSQNRRLETAILEADELPEPTDEEMQAEEPEWEDMTPTEQKLARKVLHNERKNAIIAKAGKEGHLVNEWMDKVDVFLADPASLTDHPELEGKEEEFKTFAIKPTRRGADFEDLVAAFLYSKRGVVPETPKKAKMFESGGASGDGERPKPNEGKIDLMEARRLRVTNYPKYLEYLKAGKIDNSEL